MLAATKHYIVFTQCSQLPFIESLCICILHLQFSGNRNCAIDNISKNSFKKLSWKVVARQKCFK